MQTYSKLERPAPRPYAALPLGWAAVVLLLTLTPSINMPATPAWELLSFDTAAHAGVFWVLAALSGFTLRRQRRWPHIARHVGLVVLVLSVLFGSLIEVLQGTMGLGRHGEWTDLISDGIGAAVAVTMAAVWDGWQTRRANRFASVLWFGLLVTGSLAPARGQNLPRARSTIEKLASPDMHGRGYVQQGEHKAAAYLRNRLRELKLEPLAPNYTQPFALDVNTFPGKMSLAVGSAAGPGTSGYKAAQPLVAGADFIAAAASAGTAKAISALALRLDSLVFTEPARQQAFQAELRMLLKASKGAAKPLLVLTASEEKKLAALPDAFRQTVDSVSGRVVLVPKLTASLAPVQEKGIRFEALSNPRIWEASQHSRYSMLTFELTAQLQRNYQTQNLAAIVRGAAQPDSFLVVTAHYDHLGRMGSKVYFPGANDNASGVALLLELAAHYARPENRPSYSMVFLLFGAEEAGLVGSSYFVAHPLVPLTSIKFLVNLDLLGTGEQGATVVNGRTLEVPYRRLTALNDARRYLPQLAPRGRAANSDHFPFSEAGVPAFFLYTRGGSTAYHDVNDRLGALSLAGFAGAFGLVRDFLNEMGAGVATKK